MPKNEPTPEDIKPDLKHDTMEYSASTDGDEIIDADLIEDEDEELTADELALIDDIDLEEESAALQSVEADRDTDSDVNFNENDTDEPYDEETGDSDKEDFERP